MAESAIRSPAGGVNQSGLRDHNERLVLSMVQRHGSLAGAEIARLVNLSPQTVSNILRRLEDGGLLRRQAAQRGRVGKPSTPLALDPDGVLSLGLKIGRRTADIVLVDFTGEVRARRSIAYPYPEPGRVLGFARDAVADIRRGLAPAQRERIAGIGIAAPFEIWNWQHAVGAPVEAMAAWRELDLAGEIGALTGLPVVSENDATAACTAEHHLGIGRAFGDYAYVFVGAFVGGGVVLSDRVYAGPSGNAGAFGSLPVPDGAGGTTQLLHTASLYLLERRLAAAGRDPLSLWQSGDDWSALEPELGAWIEATGRQLALAAVTVASVIDFGAVVIDGACPPEVRARLVRATEAALPEVEAPGILPPRILEGSVGREARSVGAALLPILAGYMLGGRRALA